MTLCKCGQKVERHKETKSKVQCFLCHQFFHAECCDILDKDIDLVKGTFKCDTCKRERKLPNVSTLSNGNSLIPPKVTGAVSKRSQALLSSHGADDAAFERLSEEVVALRKSNEELNLALSALRLENCKLNTKVDEVLLLVKQMHSSIYKPEAENLSPKRKKSSVKNNANPVKPISSSADNATMKTISNLPASVTFDAMETEVIWPVVGESHAQSRSILPPASFAGIARAGMNSLARRDVQTPPLENANLAWMRIGKKNKSKISLVGTGVNNNDIDVVKNFKWLHVASFRNTVSETDVVNYLSKTTNIPVSNFACHKLVKKGHDVKDLNFINFKLGIVSEYYERVSNSACWPANVRVRPFEFREMRRGTVPTGGPMPTDNSEAAAGSGTAAGSRPAADSGTADGSKPAAGSELVVGPDPVACSEPDMGSKAIVAPELTASTELTTGSINSFLEAPGALPLTVPEAPTTKV